MTSELHSIWQGTFQLFGVDIRCHVLSDGQRIIEAESMRELLVAMSKEGNGGDVTESLGTFMEWLKGN